jgi:hypothetical protein
MEMERELTLSVLTAFSDDLLMRANRLARLTRGQSTTCRQFYFVSRSPTWFGGH